MHHLCPRQCHRCEDCFKLADDPPFCINMTDSDCNVDVQSSGGYKMQHICPKKCLACDSLDIDLVPPPLHLDESEVVAEGNGDDFNYLYLIALTGLLLLCIPCFLHFARRKNNDDGKITIGL